MPKRVVIAFAAGFLLAGCGTARVSTVGSAATASVRTLAIVPGGGLLADAVAVELASRGFTVVDPASTSSMMVRLNLNEIEISRPEGLSKLKNQGVDAVLVVRGAAQENGGDPQSASARMTSTQNGALIAGVTWQNGWGGQSGSIADRAMRKGLSEAAAQIASELAARVRPSL